MNMLRTSEVHMCLEDLQRVFKIPTKTKLTIELTYAHNKSLQSFMQVNGNSYHSALLSFSSDKWDLDLENL